MSNPKIVIGLLIGLAMAALGGASIAVELAVEGGPGVYTALFVATVAVWLPVMTWAICRNQR